MYMQYNSEKELMMDLKLMFNNARQYNEDGSQIYNDANTLEKAMKKKDRRVKKVTLYSAHIYEEEKSDKNIGGLLISRC